MEYLVFEKDFLEIPFQDMEGADLIVCLDPQKRLTTAADKGDTWCVVSINEDGTYLDGKGLFWNKKMAIQFADSFK